MEDFSKILEINKLQLDKEWQELPSYYAYYSEELNKKRAEKDKLLQQINVLRAEKDLYYRRNPPYDVKITESVVQSLIECDSDISTRKEKLQELDAQIALLYTAVNSIEMKKTALEYLTKLYLSGYYGTKNMTDLIGDEIRENLNKGRSEV